jgi:hypothetical protein
MTFTTDILIELSKENHSQNPFANMNTDYCLVHGYRAEQHLPVKYFSADFPLFISKNCFTEMCEDGVDPGHVVPAPGEVGPEPGQVSSLHPLQQLKQNMNTPGGLLYPFLLLPSSL